jgi:hypothetical protein
VVVSNTETWIAGEVGGKMYIFLGILQTINSYRNQKLERDEKREQKQRNLRFASAILHSLLSLVADITIAGYS